MTYALGAPGDLVRAFVEAATMAAAQGEMLAGEVCIQVGEIIGGASISPDGKTVVAPVNG